MKKIIFSLSFLMLFVTAGFSQEEATEKEVLKSKKGTPYLPKAGDYALGVAATPFLNFAGEAVKINSGGPFNSPAAFNFLNGNNFIYGKYFIDDATAVRLMINITRNSTTDRDYSTKSGTTTGEEVEDKHTRTTSNTYLGAGIENRRGYGRLVGFYGATASITLQNGQTDKYEYGNAITGVYTNPARTNFVGSGAGANLEVKRKSGFGMGLNGFVGVEYFILPKISLGGEFTWGVAYNQAGNSGRTVTTSEAWDALSGAVATTEVETGKTSTFNITTGNTGGALYLLFHF